MAWLSRYSMLAVLIGLCLVFSFATLTKQQPNPPDAAEQILRALRAVPPQPVLVVSTSSREDLDFVDAFRGKFDAWTNPAPTNRAPTNRAPTNQEPSNNEPTWAVSFVAGTPQEARKAIDGSTSNRMILVVSPDAQTWKLLEGLGEKFPGKELRVIAPEPVIWPSFLKSQNLINIVNQIVIIAILAIGMTLVILTGGIDLSVGSLIALSAVICTRAIRDWGGGEQAEGITILLCGVLALLVCALAGLVNGLLVVYSQLPPFIATLGMMLIASGSAFLLCKGQSIAAVPDSFVWLGRGTWFGLPVAVILMACMYAATHIVMRSTVYGRAIYAIGGNAEAARLCGIRVRTVIASTYVLCGLLAGLGGLVMASRLKSGDATYGAMYELYVIAAVVVGGTSLRGGYGSVLGTLVGALIIAVIENGMNLIQIESYMQKVVFGLVILGAVLLDRNARDRR